MFEPFDERIIRKEFDLLEPRDRAKLVAVMTAFEEAGGTDPYPAKIDSYGEGLLRLRHVKAAYSGRVLFCGNQDRYVILAVYKKEGRRAPTSVIEKARRRMKQVQEREEDQP